MESAAISRGERKPLRFVQPRVAIGRHNKKPVTPVRVEPWLPDGVDLEYLETAIIPTSQWNNVPPCPSQRDEAERVRAGKAAHLFKFHPSHRKAVGCILPDGRRYRVEGNTRLFVWNHGMSDAVPDTMIIEWWKARDDEAVITRYNHENSAVTIKTGPDEVTGNARKNGANFSSPMLHSGQISSAVKSLWHYLFRSRPKRGEAPRVIAESINEFMPELTALDRMGITQRRFPTSVVMAAIFSLRVGGPKAEKFWHAYANDEGCKIDGDRDAVTVFESRIQATLKKAPGTREKAMMREAIGAIKAYAKNATYTKERGYAACSPEKLRELADTFFGEI